MIPYTITTNSLTCLIEGMPKTIEKSHVNFQKIIEAIQLGDEGLVISLSDVAKEVHKYGSGKVKVSDGIVYYQDKELHNYAVDKLLQFMEEELPIEPLVKFLENLMDNPSYRAVQELYKFMEVGNMPLTSDGCFLAYKKVRSNFFDIHSGTFDNSVGQKPSMPRNEVNEDSNVTCSSGLHACSFGYLGSFGSSPENKVVVVKINPKDVVSIPADYNSTKMRVCEYEVIEDVTEQYNKQQDVLAESIIYKYEEEYDERRIEMYSKDGDYIMDFEDLYEAERVSGVPQGLIQEALDNGYEGTVGNFQWSYE